MFSIKNSLKYYEYHENHVKQAFPALESAYFSYAIWALGCYFKKWTNGFMLQINYSTTVLKSCYLINSCLNGLK